MSNEEERERFQQEIEALRQGLKEATETIASQQKQLQRASEIIAALQERVRILEEQQAKDSHYSNLPPSADRFVRAPKSLREKSGKKPGGQRGHPGHQLRQVKSPDQIVVHEVEYCGHCQQDL